MNTESLRLESGSSTNRTVMLVDDNHEVLKATERFLKSRGFGVITSDSPFGVCAMVEQHTPAVVVLDVAMRSLDGCTLAGLLVTRDGGFVPRILLHSALPEEELRSYAERLPGVGYVAKVHGPVALAEAIEQLLA